MTNETLRDRNANDAIAILESLNKDQLEEVLRRTLKAIVQLEYRELMQENEELREQIAEAEEANEKMLEKFSEVDDYIREVECWIDQVPAEPDVSDYV